MTEDDKMKVARFVVRHGSVIFAIVTVVLMVLMWCVGRAL